VPQILETPMIHSTILQHSCAIVADTCREDAILQVRAPAFHINPVSTRHVMRHSMRSL